MRTREQIANICWIIEKAREFQKNIDLCFIDYTKAFDCVDHNKLWKALKEMGIQDHFIHILRNLYLGNKQQLKPCMEQLTGSGLRREYKAVYCHHVYLIYKQSTSCEIPGWNEDDGEISTTSDMKRIPLLRQKAKRN